MDRDPGVLAVAGWGNDLTDLGGGSDKSTYSRLLQRPPLSPQTLETLYFQCALARRIVDRMPDDAVKEGFDFEGLSSLQLRRAASAIEDLDVIGTIVEAAKQARLYGGALIVPLLRETLQGDRVQGSANERPLDPRTVRELMGFEIVPSVDAYPDGLDGRQGSRAWTDPEYYRLWGEVRIHRSRVIRLNGLRVPARVARRNRGWSYSVLEPVWESLRRLGTVRGYMESLAHNISVSVLKVGGLGKKILGGPDGKAKAMAAVRELQMQADNLHWLALDRDDSFDMSNRPMQGLKDLDERAVEALVMDTNYPREILTGQTLSGLNSGANSGPIRSYYDACDHDRKKDYTPALISILELLGYARGLTQLATGDYTIRWRPLWTPSEIELSQIRESNARADKTMVDMRAVLPSEVRRNRAQEGNTGALVVEGEIPGADDPPPPPVAPAAAPEPPAAEAA